MARLPILSSLFFIALIHVTMSTSVQDFFPKIKNNLTKIKWSHATNSKEDLVKALNSDEIQMIEADVVMGRKNESTSGYIPIMAHPPFNTSDLTLNEFLDMSLNPRNGSKKGIKLDFKSIEAFEKAKEALNKSPNTRVPIWVNADILKGPVNATIEPVDAKRFLEIATKLEVKPTLSIGWTTRATVANATSYTREQIQEMLQLVKEMVKTNQPITYPVRACFAANDIELMKTLLNDTPANNNATLTIWSNKDEDDNVDTDKLSLLVRTIGIDKVFIDVPNSVFEKLNFNSAFTSTSSIFVVFASMIVALYSAKLL